MSNTRFKLVNNGETLLDMEFIELNALVAQAQLGLDLSNAMSAACNQEVWSSRLAELLKTKTGKEFTPTQAWLIACSNREQLEEYRKSFLVGHS